MTPPAMISLRLRVHESWNRQVDQSCLFRNNRLKCLRNDVDTGEVKLARLPQQHVILDASTSTTANDCSGNDNRVVAPISICNCQIEERDTPAGHTRIPKEASTYQEGTGKKQRTGIPDERFPFLGSVPFGKPVLFAGLFSDRKKQNAPGLFSSLGDVWHILMPRHLLMAFGPRARDKRNTLFHVSNRLPFDVGIVVMVVRTRRAPPDNMSTLTTAN